MNQGIIFRHRNKAKAEPFETKVLDDLLAESFPNMTFVSVSDLKSFEKAIETANHKIIIFDWVSHPSPTEVIEKYYQSKFCRSLMVIYHNGFRKRERFFLQEYNVREAVIVKDPLITLAYADLVVMMNQILSATENIIKIRRTQIGIHFYLANNEPEKAQLLIDKLSKLMTPADKVFYKALVQKTKGDFPAAIETLENNSAVSTKNKNLLGTLYYHTQNFAKALDVFQSANQESTLNLRRNLLISRSLDRLAKDDPSLRKEAMTAFLATYKIAPHYGGVISEIISLIMDTQTIENIPLVTALLEQLPSKEMIKVYKKLEKLSDPFKTAFADLVVNTMSKAANKMIQEDDLTALKYYNYIGKLLPEGDEKRRIALDYCIARAYFRFGQLEVADDICKKVIERSAGSYEKAVALGMLIGKALRGEFDVLLDEEKDWLIQKRPA